MLQDARGLPDKSEIHADICIIGAGAAGLTVACELADGPFHTVVLESGGTSYSGPTQRLHRGINAGQRYEPLDLCRIRGFGGSTFGGWGGWCKPLSPIDFERRTWVSMSGWPIRCDELHRYYDRAGHSLGLGSIVSGSSSSSAEQAPLLQLGGTACDNEASNLCARHILKRSGEARLRAANNVLALLHANVTELDTDRDARSVTGVRAVTLAGNAFRVTASYYVLAAGGIENARLLLVSRAAMECGLGNESDLVGRCFMEHPRFAWGRISAGRFEQSFRRYHPADVIRQSGVRHESVPEPTPSAAGLVLRPEVQRREEILNARSWIVPIPDGGETRGGQELRELVFWFKKRRIPSDTLVRLRIAAQDFPSLSRSLAAYYRARWGRARQFGFVTVMEQEPNSSSRVSLDSSRDQLGIPRVRLDWKLGELERKTLKKNQQIIVGCLSRLGLDCSADAARTSSRKEELEESPRWVWHHMGTTRMAASSKLGVVDSNCRVFGVSNLYVAGSSVFPTGGNDMPTLTIVALAHRIADHVKLQYRRPSLVIEVAREDA
jgi:choline dehydrogenase-like flavoprotein